MFEYAFKSVWRKPMRNAILCAIFVLIFLGEYTGIYLYSIAKQGEKDAFKYNGFAISIYGEDLNMTESTYSEILSIPHITGVNNWKEAISESDEIVCVKDHIGKDPDASQTDDDWNTNSFVMLALMDTSLDSWFYCEKTVSLTEGTYPTAENGGVMIENRLAKLNALTAGDEITFKIDEFGKECTLQICGIFKADTDFVIMENNNMGEEVYKYSPYNRVFVNYATLAEIGNYEAYPSEGCQVFVDDAENVDEVAVSLRVLFGDKAEIYNNTTTYLEHSCSAVSIMKKFSSLILGGVFTLGSVVLLILFAIFAHQYRYESGIFLALGTGKHKALAQFFLSMLILILISLCVVAIIFSISSDFIITAVDKFVFRASSLSSVSNGVAGPYAYTSLGLGFQLNADVSGLVGSSGFIGMSVIALSFLLISLLIPYYSISKIKPKELLRSN